jgi:hypothetical protein
VPIKSRRSRERAHRITPAALEAYAASDRLALDKALGLKPWQVSPLDVDDGPAPWPAGSGGALSWALALALRAELVAANRS